MRGSVGKGCHSLRPIQSWQLSGIRQRIMASNLQNSQQGPVQRSGGPAAMFALLVASRMSGRLQSVIEQNLGCQQAAQSAQGTNAASAAA